LGAAAGIIAISTGMGVLMTVLAAIAPAIQAAKMPAAAALRVDI
jgi:ABC-type lipoprotein release transport system permease subunit